MLRRGAQGTEPLQIRKVHQQLRRTRLPDFDPFFAKQVFIADVDRNVITLHLHERLMVRTGTKATHRDTHRIDIPLETVGHEFTERYQMALFVNRQLTVGFQIHGSIGKIIKLRFPECVEKQTGFVRLSPIIQTSPLMSRETLYGSRENGFRQHHNIRLEFIRIHRLQVRIGLIKTLRQRLFDHARLKIGLNHANGQFTGRCRPLNRLTDHAKHHDRHDHQSGRRHIDPLAFAIPNPKRPN